MADKMCWESVKGDAHSILETVKKVVHEGNVRRIVVEHKGRTVAEFPLTAGVVGAVLAPAVAGIGALIAVLKDCTIQLEKVEQDAAERPKASGE